MIEESQGREAAMRSYYDHERLALRLAVSTGERLLARDQFNSTTDREARKTEVESAKEQLKNLKIKEIMEYKAIWSAYDGLWPEVHELPTTTSLRGG